MRDANWNEREADEALRRAATAPESATLFIGHAQARALLAISQRLAELNDYLRAGSRGERS